MNKRKKWEQSLIRREYGNKPSELYSRNVEAVSGYYRQHTEDFQVDDITWNDLDMDKVYKRINYTKSAAGAEVLYFLLRTTCFDEDELKHRHDIAETVTGDYDTRTELSRLFMQIGNTGKYSLMDYLEHLEQVKMKSNLLRILFDLLYIPVIAMLFYVPELAVSLLFFMICISIMTYFKEKGKVNAYLVSFGYILRMIKGAKLLVKKSYPILKKEQQELQQCIRSLEDFSRFSAVAMSMNNPMGGGNPLDLFMDYIKMIFHVDIMKFYRMLRVVKANRREIERLFYLTGYIDACMSIGFYRASLVEREGSGDCETEARNGFCIPEFGGTFMAEGMYHPLLSNPVKNSLKVERGILLTGSNASGKSTFLKTMAINTIFAQSIYTCLADEFCMPMVRTFSSMALKDDIEQGESYFMVEIKALKRILDRCRQSREKVFCIVDEVLRGTNTVERIAAACQILKTLQGGNIICFAATHDIELTELLNGQYDNYHFEECMENGDIRFNYELKKGPATTRNAIRLLQTLGYGEDITENAERMAEDFLKNGVWNM